eukprot:366256-Chlamydomonas_euryale.AAC.21
MRSSRSSGRPYQPQESHCASRTKAPMQRERAWQQSKAAVEGSLVECLLVEHLRAAAPIEPKACPAPCRGHGGAPVRGGIAAEVFGGGRSGTAGASSPLRSAPQWGN